MNSTDNESNTQDLTRHDVAAKLRDTGVVMLTTAVGGDKLVSHPMTIQGVTDDADVWFFVGLEGDQAGALSGDSAVNISIAAAGSWLSVAGHAEFVDDRGKVQELWNDSAEGYFPAGPGDPNLGLLLVRTDSAQFWGLPGGRIAGAAHMVKAMVTKGRAPGGTDTTEL
ncbi:pyridoxamine 5'-phosphate oxidase family protein [Brachybacterium sp. MASK1Z-5]|uniref:Pyridoxamine 5'-phosphate oxidase family protein n=1 Tax=Brachybacterium halotolerans TaxID=2795215 RepID=A0ABS1BEU6_9MICO|nr:pyridoxamine 5'-phosphate oxidase family protein [Brachybacterium halotolerans]MBK0333097.1 pyridoxamine 5'-phosphate oxidase family protein [Brachybacterium halotolerans]